MRARLAELRAELPPGFDFRVQRDAAHDLEKMLAKLASMAAAGTLLSVFVLLAFVRRWRIALVVAITIPASILVTFNLMYACGLSLNLLSLLGLAAGVGMLVDNSIVVVENVLRHSQRIRDPREAAWEGAREVVRAILLSTATTVAVFAPFLFLDQLQLMLVADMALSLIFPLIVSLGIAITLIPMLAAQVVGKLGRRGAEGAPRAKRGFWRRGQHPPRHLFREFAFYWTKGAMRHPVRLGAALVLAVLLTLLAGSIKLAVQMSHRPSENDSVVLYAKPHVGSTLEETDALFQAKEREAAALLAHEPVFDYFQSAFQASGGMLALHVADEYRRRDEEWLKEHARLLVSGDAHSGFRLYPFPQAAMQAQAGPVMYQPRGRGGERVRVVGENYEAMQEGARRVKELIERWPGCTDVDVDVPMGEAELVFEPDMELIAAAGADLSSMGRFMAARAGRGVETGVTIGERDARREVRIRVKTRDEEEPEARAQTLSTVNPYSPSNTSPGAEAPKRSTPSMSPCAPM